MTATIRSPILREGDRTFRYAPALNRARHGAQGAWTGTKSATVQTTAIDNEAGLIRLTTILAHASTTSILPDWAQSVRAAPMGVDFGSVPP